MAHSFEWDTEALLTVTAGPLLAECNSNSAQYGLVLSETQLQELTHRRIQALKQTGRIEFGKGILKPLIEAFCDSPYLTQQDYADTLAQLQDLFYEWKGECRERLADEELLQIMRALFDQRAHGSVEYLEGVDHTELFRIARGGVIRTQSEWEDEVDES